MKTFLTIILAGVLVFGVIDGALAGQKSDEAKKAYKELYDLIYDDEYERAYEQAIKFMEAYSESKWADAAYYWKCYAFQRAKRADEEAFECYQEFIAQYPKSKWADDARKEQVKLAKRLSRAGNPKYKTMLKTMEKGGHGNDDLKIAALWAMLANKDDDVDLDTIKSLYKGLDDPHMRRRPGLLVGVQEGAPADLGSIDDRLPGLLSHDLKCPADLAGAQSNPLVEQVVALDPVVRCDVLQTLRQPALGVLPPQ